MNTFQHFGALLLIGSTVAASSMIAMRVETEATSADGENTVISITVAIAPEDRARTGSSVWVAGELRRGSEVVDRFDTRAAMDRKGSTSFEKIWPPGSYELRIDVESTSSNATGFWEGRILVPRMRPEPPPTPDPVVGTEPPARETPPPTQHAPPEPDEAPIAAQEEAAAKPAEPPGIAAMMAAAAAKTPPPAVTATEPKAAPADQQTASPTSEAESPAMPAPAAPATPPRTAGMPTITVFATDSVNRPVTSLKSRDFELRIGGKTTKVEAVDGAGSELLLGFAVDISSTAAELLPEARRMIRRLAERSAAPGSSIFLVTAAETPRLELAPGSAAPDLSGQLRQSAADAEVDLAATLEFALKQFEGQPGRRILVVVSDGGDISSKDRWKRVLDTIASSGIPVLVIAFDEGEMSGRTVSRLRRTAESSGGKFYSLRNTDVLRLTVDHFSELVEASYAIGFESGQTTSQKLKVSVPGGNVEILHSKEIRP